MLKFDLKNKFKGDNKNGGSKRVEKNHVQEEDSEKIKSDILKTEMIASIIKGGISDKEEDKTITFADMTAVEEELEPKAAKILEQNANDKLEQTLEAKVVETLETKVEEKLKAKLEEKLGPKFEEKLGPKFEEKLGPKFEEKLAPWSEEKQKVEFQQKHDVPKLVKRISPESEKISNLIKAIEASSEKMIIPSVEMGTGKISYPLLTQIGEEEDNLDLLEKLASPNFDILERTVHERLVVCPEHPESMSTSVRLSCPKCSSMDISKLHLIEHRRCGYISENKNFEISDDGKIVKCPSCKKPIRDAKKEIAKPAMWYTCTSCKEKFDDVSIRLYCRKFNHDFEISESHSLLIPGFTLKNLQDTSNASISPILKPLKKLLGSKGFSAEENYTITGKSGNHYRINIYGENEHKRTVFIYIKNPNAENDNSELNSKIIEVLDTSPSVTIFIGFPSISEKAKAITSNYNISLITEKDPGKILSSIKDILENKVSEPES